MYSIIIAIHAVFIFITHLLGYQVFEVIFGLLCIFFLFYFSPLFFQDEGEKGVEKKSFDLSQFFEKFSPRDSLILPLGLLYIAVYGFVISAFGNSESFLSIHSILSLGVYLILFGYILSFSWKNDMFFEIVSFHLYLSFITSTIFGILFYFSYSHTNILFPLLGIATFVGAYFYMIYARNIPKIFSILFYISTFFTIFSVIIWLFTPDALTFLLGELFFFGVFVFEYAGKLHFLKQNIYTLKFLGLLSTIIILPVLFYLSFFSLTFPFFLLVFAIVFFFSVHIRYSNYIVYSTALGIIYFLYSLFFFSLLTSGALTSVLLFIFFLPFLLLGLTYFWEERFEYDFMILHYSGILFSILFSIYSIFFIGWGPDLLFVISSCIFGLALLFFLSYFRFRKD